jgi:hypothetical protein
MPYCSECGSAISGWFCSNCGSQYKQVDPTEVTGAAEELRRQFIDDFYPLKTSYSHMQEAATIFLEAASCCMNHEYLATAILGRAALESALCRARITRLESGSPVIDEAVAELLPDVQFPWFLLLRWAVRTGTLDRELAPLAGRIRELGNFYVPGHQVADRITTYSDRPYDFPVSPEDAYWALNATRQVLLRMAQRS